jgi:hypothetical protein
MVKSNRNLSPNVIRTLQAVVNYCSFFNFTSVDYATVCAFLMSALGAPTSCFWVVSCFLVSS